MDHPSHRAHLRYRPYPQHVFPRPSLCARHRLRLSVSNLPNPLPQAIYPRNASLTDISPSPNRRSGLPQNPRSSRKHSPLDRREIEPIRPTSPLRFHRSEDVREIRRASYVECACIWCGGDRDADDVYGEYGAIGTLKLIYVAVHVWLWSQGIDI